MRREGTGNMVRYIATMKKTKGTARSRAKTITTTTSTTRPPKHPNTDAEKARKIYGESKQARSPAANDRPDLPRAKNRGHRDALAPKIFLQELGHPRGPAVSFADEGDVLDIHRVHTCIVRGGGGDE